MIEVIRRGASLSIQDLGRYGYRKYGVPVGGVMDRQAAIESNIIIGNRINAPLIEAYMPGHKILFTEQVSFCICGAIGEYKLNDKRLENNKVITANANDTLSIGKMDVGSWLYIAFDRPLIVNKVLDSFSSLHGIFDTQLQRGSTIKMGQKPPLSGSSTLLKPNIIDRSDIVLAYRGPEYDLLDANVKIFLLSNSFQITNTISKMGYRLSGDPASNYKSFSILSAAVMPGTVQLLPNGLPLILMRECATTGGYPRVLQLTENSINQIAQKRPGDNITFKLDQDSMK